MANRLDDPHNASAPVNASSPISSDILTVFGLGWMGQQPTGINSPAGAAGRRIIVLSCCGDG